MRETWEEAGATVEVISPFAQLDIPLIGQVRYTYKTSLVCFSSFVRIVVLIWLLGFFGADVCDFFSKTEEPAFRAWS